MSQKEPVKTYRVVNVNSWQGLRFSSVFIPFFSRRILILKVAVWL